MRKQLSLDEAIVSGSVLCWLILGWRGAGHFHRLELEIRDLDRHQSGSPLPLPGRQVRLRFVELSVLQLQIFCCLPERVGV